MANSTKQFPSISNPGLANDKECNLPWEDFVEKHPEADVDLPILVCLLLTLVFDTLLVAIILLHDELRKRRNNLFMVSIFVSDMAFALFLILLCQPGFNKGRYIDFVNQSYLTCQTSQTLGTFLITAPWYNFMGLNIERLYAIKRPFDYRASLLKHSWSRAILVCWGLAILPAVPLMFSKTIWHNWEGKENCKCFFPLDDKVWVFWACTTNFLIPTVLILLIWGLMVHHYIVNPASDQTSRALKRVTQKTVLITSLFLITVSPFCLVFAHAGLNVPAYTTTTIDQADKYSTKLLDITFTFPLLNGMIQPIVYILSFENLRGIFVNIIFFKRSNQRQNLKMDIFRTAPSYVDKPGCEVEENIPESPRQSPETRKSSVLSQVTILSEDESMALMGKTPQTCTVTIGGCQKKVTPF